MQKDLLAPQSARAYLPAILRAASKASPKAAEWAERDQIVRYLNFCSMDMFNGVHFGAHNEMPEKDYQDFCEAAVDGLGMGINLNLDPWARLAAKMGWETSTVRDFYATLDRVNDISERRQRQVLEQVKSGNLTDSDRESYFYKSLQRMEESDLSMKEVVEIGVILMSASVDTTAGKTAWNVLQLALHPEAQDRLRRELRSAVQVEGGLTPAVLDLPYLKAFIRETHRCTPVTPLATAKELQAPTEIHGVELPAGTMVCLTPDSHFDPKLLKDPLEFRPERWLPEAVEARKNTPAALVDHPFFSGPFSQGARRCPGSRVAYLEVQAMLAQLVLDWEIQAPPSLRWTDIPSTMATVIVPVFPEGTRFVQTGSPVS